MSSFFLKNKLGFDDDGKYDGTQHYYWAYDQHLQGQFRQGGVDWVLKNELYILPKPTAAIARVTQNNYPNTAAGRDQHDNDVDLVAQYKKELKVKVPLIGKAYGILIDSLSVYPLATVRHILDDDNLDDRTRIQNVVTYFREHDGAVTPTKVAAIEKQISDIPPATEAKSAHYLLAALTNFNGLLKKYGDAYHLSGAKLRHILSQALQDPIFLTVVAKIDDSPDMTWEQMSQAVTNAIARHASNEFLTSRKRPADDLMYSATIQSMSSTALPSNIVAMQRNPSFKCWNCSGSDHHARHCVALFCNNCGNSFPSRDHPSYHSFFNCPWVAHQTQPRPQQQSQPRPQQQSQPQHQPFVRYVRDRSMGGRGSRSGRGRGGIPHGGYQINAATVEAQEYDDEVDPWG
jgi:hypothetical protein